MSEDIVKFIRRRDYRYVRELGKGGCGKTVLLHDDVIDQYFVCKKFEPSDPKLKEQLFPGFMNEIRLMHQTFHPNVVRVFGHHVEPQLHLGYILMEHVEGETIDKFISLNPDSFESVFRQTTAAFCHLEQNRILHRDLRYTNILVRNDGVVKVIDLGFGKEVKKNSDFNKSVTLNWAFTPPDDFFQQTYDFRTEIYFVGRLFMSIMMQESIAQKEILSVLRKMCVDDPGARIATFAEVQQALDKSILSAPEFSEEEVAAYRDFADTVISALGTIEVSAIYISDPSTVLGRLEKLYESCVLEPSTDCTSVLRCLIKGSYTRFPDKPFWVESIRNFIHLLKSRDTEGQRIILANLARRLDKVKRYDENEIPF